MSTRHPRLMLIFKRRDLSGWAKAAWIVFVIFVPLLGSWPTYLVARGGRLAEEQVSEYGAPRTRGTVPTRSEARGRHSADELTKLADLRDRGVSTDDEFQKGKVQLLG